LTLSCTNDIVTPNLLSWGGVLTEGEILAAKELRINQAIRVREVRLITDSGEQDVVSIEDAINMANNSGMDLVEIAPQASPPVCRIMDYGKYKFEQEKRLKESKKRQKLVKLKEIRMQPRIEKHDLAFKTKHIIEFLEDGNKVKVTIRFRGRELAHTELGKDVLIKAIDLLTEQEVGFNVDIPPKMEGRFMSMILSPKNKK
jgi:translation initiation factor IF-3